MFNVLKFNLIYTELHNKVRVLKGLLEDFDLFPVLNAIFRGGGPESLPGDGAAAAEPDRRAALPAAEPEGRAAGGQGGASDGGEERRQEGGGDGDTAGGDGEWLDGQEGGRHQALWPWGVVFLWVSGGEGRLRGIGGM